MITFSTPSVQKYAKVDSAIATETHVQSLARKYVRGTSTWATSVAISIFLELYLSISQPKG